MILRGLACGFFYPAALQPRVNLTCKGVNRTLLAVQVTMNRQSLLTFPSASCPYAPFQVGCDFFP